MNNKVNEEVSKFNNFNKNNEEFINKNLNNYKSNIGYTGNISNINNSNIGNNVSNIQEQENLKLNDLSKIYLSNKLRELSKK